MTTRPRDLARVLVVGDDRGIRERARDLLEGVVRVEACAGAEEALEALAAEPADLVLSDQTLPGHSGLELLEQILGEGVHRHLRRDGPAAMAGQVHGVRVQAQRRQRLTPRVDFAAATVGAMQQDDVDGRIRK